MKRNNLALLAGFGHIPACRRKGEDTELGDKASLTSLVHIGMNNTEAVNLIHDSVLQVDYAIPWVMWHSPETLEHMEKE